MLAEDRMRVFTSPEDPIGEKSEKALQEAFPRVDPGKRPCGGRVLVQMRKPKDRTTKSGILLVEETKDSEKWETNVAKVISLGPLAFRHRETMKEWIEGAWCEPGDYVTVPKWAGDRWDRPNFGSIDAKGKPGVVYFAIFNDHEIIAVIDGDPLSFVAFVE